VIGLIDSWLLIDVVTVVSIEWQLSYDRNM
jgi:hypothetical protein